MIVVTGHFSVHPEVIERLRPAMRAVLLANRQEDGCLHFAYGDDILEPGTIRVIEHWRDWSALDAHGKSAHVAAWRAELARVGLLSRTVIAYEAGEQRAI